MNFKAMLRFLPFLLLTCLLAGCGTKATPEPTEPVGETPTVVAPAKLTLGGLADGIQSGAIDVGSEFGMAIGQRFHTIHVETIEMSCVQCHVGSAPDEMSKPATGSPGVVDRRICLGCHLNGPASSLYASKE